MQDNRRDNEKDVDLTGMIHEYSQDNELRKKIEEMKRQKEAEKNVTNEKVQESYHSELFDDIRPENTFTNNNKNMSDIRVDQEDIEKTRVGFQDSDINKTLVIMDGKKATSFGAQEATLQTEAMDDDSYLEDDEYDDFNKTIVQPISKDNDVHTLDLDENEKYEDDLGIEHTNNKEKDTKMNKIITFIIIGLVVLVLLIGGFFGIKALMGGSSSSSDKKTDTNTTTDKDKDTDTDIDKDKEEDETNQNDKNKDVTNNEAKIASLNQQITNYEADLTEARNKLQNAQTEYDNANQKLQELLSDSEMKQNEANTYSNNIYTPKKIAKEEAEKAMHAVTETDPTYAALKLAYETAEQAVEPLETEYERLQEIAETANSNYNNSPYKTTASTAAGKLSELNSQIESLQNKIDEAKAELETLQK